MQSQVDRIGRRRSLLVAVMLGPSLIMALGMIAFGPWRFHRPDATLAAMSSTRSFPDAIAADDVQSAYALIRAGQNSNVPVTVRDPELTGGRSTRVPPLLWAVATGADRVVPMLLSFGARVDATTLSQARCLAQQRGYRDIVRQIEAYEASLLQEQCPVPETGGTTLLESLAVD